MSYCILVFLVFLVKYYRYIAAALPNVLVYLFGVVDKSAHLTWLFVFPGPAPPAVLKENVKKLYKWQRESHL